MPLVGGAVEGFIDEAVIRRIASSTGIQLDRTYVTNGKPGLKRRLSGFNEAARHSHWIVLVDLNSECSCAPELVAEWLPEPAGGMRFRVVVRSVEAWLLADREAASRFLGVASSRIPSDPEALIRPKRTVVDIARVSRRRDIRADLVPREPSGREVGVAYTARMIEYVETLWDPSVAANRSPSLRKCLDSMISLRRLL